MYQTCYVKLTYNDSHSEYSSIGVISNAFRLADGGIMAPISTIRALRDTIEFSQVPILIFTSMNFEWNILQFFDPAGNVFITEEDGLANEFQKSFLQEAYATLSK